MRRALVTGATGFIGAALVAELRRRGWTVETLGRGGASVTSHVFDILAAPRGALLAIVDRSACDTIFHFAGTTSDAGGYMDRINAGFAEAVLEAALRAAKRPGVVLAGTAAEYGAIPAEAMPVRENHACCPATRYGASKLRQTMLGIAAAQDGLTVHLPRMFNVIGPGMRPHLALGRFARDIVALGAAGGVLQTGPLDARRDFIALHDTVRTIVALSRMPQASGLVVNLCSGVSVGMEEAVAGLLAAAPGPVTVAIDRTRSGVSALPDMVGCTGRLRALGLRIGVPDMRRETAMLLRGCCAASDLAAGNAA